MTDEQVNKLSRLERELEWSKKEKVQSIIDEIVKVEKEAVVVPNTEDYMSGRVKK